MPLEAPVAGVQPLDDGLESAEAQAISNELNFDQSEGDRAVRLADKRENDSNFQVQQQIDQQIADDRIAEIQFDPNLPRGSIVDIAG